ncbi:MAG: hypothetical protein H6589_00825 [Flavobacteriales bacterium]|nr:hypothetical protein [Flavobacteriales bacterium]
MELKPKGHISCIKELYYVAKEQRGEILRGRLLSIATNRFDVRGNMIENSSFDNTYDNGFKQLYIYDERGKIIEDYNYLSQNKLSSKSCYTYKKNYKQEICTHYTNDGNTITKKTTKYINENTVLEYEEEYCDEATYKKKYRYDDNGKKLEEKTYHNNIFDQGTTYIYDERGNIIKEHYFNNEDDWTDTISEYDDENNLIKYSRFSFTGIFECCYTYKYNNKKQLIEQLHFSPDDKTLHCVTIYKYDDFGNTIEESEYSPNGDLTTSTTFKFDANSNLIEKSIYDSDVDKTSIKASYKYNNFGELIEEFQNDAENGYYKTIKFEDYDEHGNWLKSFSIDVNKEIHYLERQIEYY